MKLIVVVSYVLVNGSVVGSSDVNFIWFILNSFSHGPTDSDVTSLMSMNFL